MALARKTNFVAPLLLLLLTMLLATCTRGAPPSLGSPWLSRKPDGDDDHQHARRIYPKTQERPAFREPRFIDTSSGFEENFFGPWRHRSTTIIRAGPPTTSYSMWKPHFYQISRPYFIPIWGSHGRIPIFFPPQPFFSNPGFPVHNPPKPDRGYLPSKPDGENEQNTTMPTINKFGEDGPVWERVSPSNARTTTVRPTRRTRRPGQATTHPPIVHNSGKEEPAAPVATIRPPPSNEVEPPPPAVSAQNPPDSAGQPSRCIWATISCCSTSSAEVSYSCFEQLGCSGAFWDTSPCDSDFARAAVDNVMKFYNSNG